MLYPTKEIKIVLKEHYTYLDCKTSCVGLTLIFCIVSSEKEERHLVSVQRSPVVTFEINKTDSPQETESTKKPKTLL